MLLAIQAGFDVPMALLSPIRKMLTKLNISYFLLHPLFELLILIPKLSCLIYLFYLAKPDTIILVYSFHALLPYNHHIALINKIKSLVAIVLQRMIASKWEICLKFCYFLVKSIKDCFLKYNERFLIIL